MTHVKNTNYNEVGSGFSNEVMYAKFTWDFADSGGAQKIHQLGKFVDKVRIIMSKTVCETATAGTSGTIIIGTTADTDKFLAEATVGGATVLEDAVTTQADGQHATIAKDQEVLATIGTTTHTAGKITVHVWYINA